jgi:predicted TPR repeat methyltransferase
VKFIAFIIPYITRKQGIEPCFLVAIPSQATPLRSVEPGDSREYVEIGCSIGVLTQKLASRCDSLLSVDVSQLALDRAIERCQPLSHVSLQLMSVPEDYPEEIFDLTLVSEVGYYLCWEDLRKAQQLILDHLEPGGHLL